MLLELVPRLGRLLTTVLEAAPEPRLTLRQFRILQRLAERPQRSGELASSTGVTAPTMSVAVAGLEGQGWVARRVDPRDRRAAIVTITPSGEAVYRVARDHLREVLVAVAGDLDDADAHALSRMREPLSVGIQRARAMLRGETVEVSPGA